VDNGSVPLTNAEVLAHVVSLEHNYAQEKRTRGPDAPVPENLAPVMGVISKVRHDWNMREMCGVDDECCRCE
jgi:hypothetical protein